MDCPQRIRPLPDRLVELTCEGDHEADSTTHTSTLRDYAFPGSATKLSWLGDDRRSYTGEWSPCPVRLAGGFTCILPGGHRGACVR